MEKIWISHYPKGIPAEIDVDEYASVREIFEESAGKYGGRPAFTCMGRSMGFSELDTLSSAFGAWLQGIGCTKGSRHGRACGPFLAHRRSNGSGRSATCN